MIDIPASSAQPSGLVRCLRTVPLAVIGSALMGRPFGFQSSDYLVPTGQPPGFISDTVSYVRVQFQTAHRAMPVILTALPFYSHRPVRAGEMLPDSLQNPPSDRCDVQDYCGTT